MRTIKLNYLLLLLVIISTVTSLTMTAFIALYNDHVAAKEHAQKIALTVKKQLDWQVLKLENNIMLNKHFPDFFLWKSSHDFAGLCVIYETPTGAVERSLCQENTPETITPPWFEALYLHLFDTTDDVLTPLYSKQAVIGFIRVSPYKYTVLSSAWQKINSLMIFSAISVILFSCMLLCGFHWLFKPLRDTQTTLKTLATGQLDNRLPVFKITEWHDTACAINHLAESLNQTLKERQHLLRKLLQLQENERRFLCRELHDEFGQSLTGLRALTHSLASDTQRIAPTLYSSTQEISIITKHMMDLVKSLLFRLRPADIDELGLKESLYGLVQKWQNEHKKLTCKCVFSGDDSLVSSSIAVNLLRIIQECLTNIAKHSQADYAFVSVIVSDSVLPLQLSIMDNGNMETSNTLVNPGNGLLGIKERIDALNGTLIFSRSELGGLNVTASIPLEEIE